MSRILFWGILQAHFHAPLGVLFLFSDFAYLVVYRIVGYRRKIVFGNLERSFPEKSPEEIKTIASNFYRHLCDLMVESIRLFSISEKEAVARCKIRDVSILHKYYKEGRSIILVAGHYNSWELAAISFEPQIPHQAIGIYSPLKNPYLNKMLADSRSKFGLELVPKKELNLFLQMVKTDLPFRFLVPINLLPIIIALLDDLSKPGNSSYAGTEKYARDYNYPVVFACINKVRRGFYEVDLHLLEDQPAATPRFRNQRKTYQNARISNY